VSNAILGKDFNLVLRGFLNMFTPLGRFLICLNRPKQVLDSPSIGLDGPKEPLNNIANF